MIRYINKSMKELNSSRSKLYDWEMLMPQKLLSE